MNSKESIAEILKIVHRISGVNMKSVSSNIALGRLDKRIKKLGLSGPKDYLEYLRKETSEIEHAINIFMNNYTSFFRENQQFETLKEILPLLMINPNRPSQKTLNVWSAACSTGEEVYSLAMTLSSSLEGTPFDFKILGTDIDSNCINIAKKAVYTAEGIKNIPEGFKEKYFLKGKGRTDGFVKIKKNIREHVRFDVYNLNSNRSLPHSGKFDLIFCRNALIYFSFETCSKVLKKLNEYLDVSAVLVLGISEPIQTQKTLIALKPCFYVTEILNQRIPRLKVAS